MDGISLLLNAVELRSQQLRLEWEFDHGYTRAAISPDAAFDPTDFGDEDTQHSVHMFGVRCLLCAFLDV